MEWLLHSWLLPNSKFTNYVFLLSGFINLYKHIKLVIKFDILELLVKQDQFSSSNSLTEN